MPQDPNTAASKPPPGFEPPPAAAPTVAVTPPEPASPDTAAALRPPDSGPPPGGDPIGKGGLPGKWGTRLPLLMLAAGLIAVGLLIATSSDRPKTSSDNFGSSSGKSQGSTPNQAVPQAPPAAADQGATGAGGATAEPDAAQTQTEVSGAKAVLVTAADAMETCATDNDGGYGNCTLDQLKTIEPTLEDETISLTVVSTDTGFTLTGRAGVADMQLTLTHAAGKTTRTCAPAGSNGCADNGTW